VFSATPVTILAHKPVAPCWLPNIETWPNNVRPLPGIHASHVSLFRQLARIVGLDAELPYQLSSFVCPSNS
jgi:hypothetical protein